MTTPAKSAQVRRVLERYLIEVVERYELCPWARGAREQGELAVAIVFGEPELAAWLAGAGAALRGEATRVAIVVAPEAALSPGALRGVRDQVAAALPAAGVAEFHPDAALDLATPGRLIPFLRRSPDPMLQLVPLAILDAVRAGAPAADRAHQAQMLGGFAAPPRPPIADRIALANHATAAAHHAEIAAALDAIAEDRRAAYARAGISGCRPRS